ncbi:hypothetical protein BS78_03G168200 [Paspalum vaginatum]|nr:hypothetical protein BS78_03G168200 [Paspalum vaginatum]
MASPGMLSSSAVTMSPSSAGSEVPSSFCDPHLAAVTAERKRKRKESNRLSAQRSRARKQRQLDDLTAQVAALRARNGAMATAAQDAWRSCAAVQAENALLQARTIELSAHLQSLAALIQCMEDTIAANPYPFAY